MISGLKTTCFFNKFTRFRLLDMNTIGEDDDFDSDTSDEDYVPGCEGEPVSEDGISGEDEDFVAGDEAQAGPATGKKKKTKSKKKPPELSARKRTGGIRLEPEEGGTPDPNQACESTDAYNKELVEHIEKEREAKKEEDSKKKADALWADFMSDVGTRKPKPKPSSGGGLSSLSSLSKPIASPSAAKSSTSASPSSSSAAAAAAGATSTPSSSNPSKVTITKEYDFAGEVVKISKEVDVDSKEAKAEKKKIEQLEEEKSKPQAGPNLAGLKRPGGGLGSVLGKIGKKPKMGTLEKSKLDWESFKQDEGIDEELQIHNRGKAGYIERKEFLERTDMRQFERERDVRLKMMNSNR